ncbi:flagellar basal body-associated FliL family protein [Rhodobacter sp. KR11]|uniref:flagellar basal body-associated FliL family protein n=1 Tax=Rhodobacter sp. KR11 TaxID=2974588 RepID=UPI0022225C24|nr:flagellar basal body-associated FliL family protein [Rhodobacter sp. KR11]MCW1919172.1 flagellar basal body-associated FliL family protein [Rhodobacter sp. KR11]
MAEAEAPQDAEPAKKSKLPLIIGLVLFLVMGGGGFFAVYSGLILAPAAPEGGAHAEPAHEELPDDFAFVAVPSVTISLGNPSDNKHLRFTAQLEVAKARSAKVEELMPRILDVLNGYMRALEETDLQQPDALVRLRSQMLRRIQMVTGEGYVRDLLVTEFVLD